MEKKTFSQWLEKQPTWIKIVVMTAIMVAAVWGTSVTTACSASYRQYKSGIHETHQRDTVNTWVKIKTNSTQF